ncbi:hypothetical protein ACQ4PT_059335 [Festuca glaucescens]
MADPITIGAAVGWGVTAVGWLASPIIPRLLNKGFALLNLNAPEKLKSLDTQVLQLQRVMEIVDESTYRVRLEPLLDKLKSALYEAEDILDSVEYQSLKEKIQHGNSDASMPPRKRDFLRKFLPCAMPSSPLKDEESGMSKSQLEKSLKMIESSISDACKVLERLNLSSVNTDNGRRAVAANSSSSVTTAGPPPRVIGRDQDRDMIIAMLHEKEDQYQANTISGTGTCYSVIGIHGIAGSGKSTLAQCVYDHEKKYKQEKMEGHFDILMWIHVSQKFDVDSIFRDMFEGATGKERPKLSSRNALKEKTGGETPWKADFVVSINLAIRNSEDREELQKLISPLHVGKAGSKILVTSRIEAALVTLGAVKERCIPISELDDKVFLEMFKHYALRDSRAGDNDQRILEMIAEDIAKKLKRSPLAARTVGSRLRETQSVEFWRSQKDQDLLNSTMGALWWSYQYLDEHIRRCFAYCSIFPRGHRLKSAELVKLWVAEGFIKISKPEEEMEDVAKNYFDELLLASFLQLGGKEKFFHYGSERFVDYFTIHDLLCDLAEEVAGRDCFRIEKGSTGEVPQDVRYLYVGTCNIEMLTEKIPRLQNLHTLIIADNIRVKSTELGAFVSMFTLLMGLYKLRVLRLRVVGNVFSTFTFPDSIGQLKHLRYFAFSVAGVTKLILPDAFTKLYHMRVLDFGSCLNLEFSGDMINLINLRLVISSGYGYGFSER